MSVEYKETDVRKNKKDSYMNANITFSYKVVCNIGDYERKVELEGLIRGDNLEFVGEVIKSIIENQIK